MGIAIVTGASSGLGREFVKQIDRDEKLDEIFVIARRLDRLQELQADCATKIRPIPMDLTKMDNLAALQALLEREKPDVRLLINNAGFGKMGDYKQVIRQDNDDILALNCRALMDMTMIVLPYMQKGARILEMCSSSSFQPLPGLSVYAASKAFVLSYSRALRWELFGRGIHVTAVCPYWVKRTEFIDVLKMTANSRAVKHFPLASRPPSVVRWALFDSKLNVAVSTPGPVSLIQRILAKFIPHCIVIAFWELIRRI